MALISCAKCGKAYSDSVTQCPHCGYAPYMRLCPECGGLCGKEEQRCRNCGFSLSGLQLAGASEEAVEAHYQQLLARMRPENSLEDWTALAECFGAMGGYRDSMEQSGACCKALEYGKEKERLDSLTTAQEWKSAREFFVSMGSYADAPDCAARCDEGYKQALYSDTLRMQQEGSQELGLILANYTELGDYQDARLRLEQTEEKLRQTREKKKKATKKGLMIAAAAAAVIAAVVFVVAWLLPYLSYQSGAKLLGQGDYAGAQAKFLEAGSFRDAAEQAELSARMHHYQLGEEAFAKGDYQLAQEEFVQAQDYSDAKARAEESEKAGHYTAAMAFFEAEDYESAIDAFRKCRGYGDAAQKIDESYYCIGQKQFAAGDYVAALKNYVSANNFQDADSKIMEVGIAALGGKNYAVAMEAFAASRQPLAPKYLAYTKGMNAFDGGSYDEAKACFTEAGEVENAADMATASQLMTVEAIFKAGKLNQAKEGYEKLPKDFVYEEISVAKRLDFLKKNNAFLKICGVWTVTKNYIESRNIHYRTGIWNNWYYDTPYYGQTVEVTCVPNENGSFNITGKVTFQRFTSYSSINAYCRPSSTSRTFTLNNKTSVPKNFINNSSTKLTYSGGKFQLKYSVKDEYSAYFYNRYRSDVTFGKRTSKY